MANNIFNFGETVTLTHFSYTREGEIKAVVGTEQAEVVGVSPTPGRVIVRPFHGDDIMQVSIKQLSR